MLYFGCLFFLLIFIFLIALNFISNVLGSVWGIISYCWNSICNLFLPKSKRKETRNPFDTYRDDTSYDQDTRHNSRNSSDTRSQGKIFDTTDGEYIDFEEIK